MYAEISAKPPVYLYSARGWLPVVVFPLSVFLFTPHDWPRWTLMWLLCFALYFGCKWLTWRRTPITSVPWWRHAAYLFAWPGMDAKAFLISDPAQRIEKPTPREWTLAFVKMLAGIALFWGAGMIVPQSNELLLGWLGITGIALALHFGVFHLLSCAWRAIGINARPLMNRPLAAGRVSEFWGQRWNTAFRDLTYRFLFRPLTRNLGPRWGILTGFVFSGLIHELVISLPAGAGYGGPTLFFLIQAAALFIERSRRGQAVGLGTGWRGWLFTMSMLAIPAFVLFHPPFLRIVILPFMTALGAA